jgi:hypothetical protein
MNEFSNRMGALARQVGQEFELTATDDSAVLIRRAKRGRVVWTGVVGTASLASAAVIAVGGSAAANNVFGTGLAPANHTEEPAPVNSPSPVVSDAPVALPAVAPSATPDVTPSSEPAPVTKEKSKSKSHHKSKHHDGAKSREDHKDCVWVDDKDGGHWSDENWGDKSGSKEWGDKSGDWGDKSGGDHAEDNSTGEGTSTGEEAASTDTASAEPVSSQAPSGE